MKAEYDLSKMKARKNPYAAKLKQPVSKCLSEDVAKMTTFTSSAPAAAPNRKAGSVKKADSQKDTLRGEYKRSDFPGDLVREKYAENLRKKTRSSKRSSR